MYESQDIRQQSKLLPYYRSKLIKDYKNKDMARSQPNNSVKESQAQAIATEVREGTGTHERAFTRWMKANLPHIKWVVRKSAVGGTSSLIVYESTEDPKKWITYLWKSLCFVQEELEDAYEYAFGVMKAFVQPTEQPLTCEDTVAELMFYARKEGYIVQWITSMHNTPHLNQFIMTGPDGYKFETKVTAWYPTCWKETKTELERITNKDFGFTFDKINREVAKKIAEELREAINTPQKE
ncbi:uncharacterized protein FOMMEDRAFT_30422 [Fomitiporia mediterranea MF3/22]|uniref:uncharacterized protein n=1 Tax=Fomitiporia mediterranea (strain MF3/22) TaxID=694068 RepID=UPI0004409A9B|nr:uncharacterized protein FOMMEDRAFT_30422 [Fomitiporia mediterranea MF3/22]EJD00350.1 hypothetical protein FOMMEDRAFT_30422 [Fomitiporia mediterranea MF3/22]